PRRPARMGLQWSPGGPAYRLVEPALVLGRAGQAAIAADQPQPGRPPLRHRHAAARHRRCARPAATVADPLPAPAESLATATGTGRRARATTPALVTVRPVKARGAA